MNRYTAEDAKATRTIQDTGFGEDQVRNSPSLFFTCESLSSALAWGLEQRVERDFRLEGSGRPHREQQWSSG
ncbi:hypothetical protein M407DRAFT_240770 [Tulasnella calospora MUT 4182]|uniref:Uncharacterized protein n=1 Tax=Tulasnella calospora MUT 4182 TaxID=1051891 RepID=A0A0C3MKB8_9AGAM|nr:hypothetical protein M407DRAFT_240770 [Tulasnella calospora MUT 4182]